MLTVPDVNQMSYICISQQSPGKIQLINSYSNIYILHANHYVGYVSSKNLTLLANSLNQDFNVRVAACLLENELNG